MYLSLAKVRSTALAPGGAKTLRADGELLNAPSFRRHRTGKYTTVYIMPPSEMIVTHHRSLPVWHAVMIESRETENCATAPPSGQP